MNQSSIYSLLEKYNVPGPRYTSYPTVPAWQEKVEAQDYQQSLAQIKSNEAISLYLHLPFCESLCHFCGCMQVITKDQSRSRSYVDVLLQEIDLVAAHIPPNNRRVIQIHLGGGTPNFIQSDEMTEIFDKISSVFQIVEDAEIAIELHPKTSRFDFNQNLKNLGFNRVSIGVQDFDDEVQKIIRRHQSYAMTTEVVNELRSLGFDSLNFDLIYGLPRQSLETWEDTLNKTLELRPSRLAVYSYAHVPWMRPVQRAFEKEDLPSPELKLQLFEKAYQFFTSHGYALIGMDHFALEDDEIVSAKENGTLHRNFMGYSTRADAHQIGLGVSSISYVAGNYFQNQKDLKNYELAIQENQLATFRGMVLSQEDAMRRDLITQIMCHGFLDISAFEKQWKLSFQEKFENELHILESIQKDDLLELDSKFIKVLNKGFLFLRNIAMPFDQYLTAIREQAKTPVFSKTV